VIAPVLPAIGLCPPVATPLVAIAWVGCIVGC
jgi:hypothetical protein